MHFVIWILGGMLAGWLVGLIMKGRGYGLIWDVALGLLGGVVGGWLFRRFGITAVGSGWLGHLFVSVIGGIVVVAAARLLRKVR
jgi:uncharacterized membrane protein YeaQ/YmgE (transglycosylase-associated protein family)